MQPLSLKWRIGICVTILMLIIVTVISIIAYYEFQESLFDILDHRLKSDISAIRQQLYTEEPNEEFKKEIRAILVQDRHSNGIGFKIWFENGSTYLSSSDVSDNIDVGHVSPPKTGEDKTFDIIDNERAYRAIWARYSDLGDNFKKGNTLNVLIYTSSEYVNHEIEEFLLALIILGGLIIWFSIGITTWILRWGLKPVSHITNLMDKVSGKHLDESSIKFPQVPQELSPFVRAWGQMLSRLSHTMKEQRRFTSDASHELRTPIATIKSTLQLARSQERPAEYYKKAIDQSLDDLERINHLIDQLLRLSHIDNIENLQDRETIDMQQLTSEVCECYSVIAQQQGRFLECKLCPAKIMGCIQLIHQLLANLIDNAIKYSPDNSTISVLMEKDNTQLKINVHDEGSGISENERYLIFERFYRLDKARARSTGGAGIGLSIAREIAQKHGGDITVSSNPMDGTSFVVAFPIES
jgi:two-component system heavy metal sensor histidine kinase CusS